MLERGLSIQWGCGSRVTHPPTLAATLVLLCLPLGGQNFVVGWAFIVTFCLDLSIFALRGRSLLQVARLLLLAFLDYTCLGHEMILTHRHGFHMVWLRRCFRTTSRLTVGGLRSLALSVPLAIHTWNKIVGKMACLLSVCVACLCMSLQMRAACTCTKMNLSFCMDTRPSKT